MKILSLGSILDFKVKGCDTELPLMGGFLVKSAWQISQGQHDVFSTSQLRGVIIETNPAHFLKKIIGEM